MSNALFKKKPMDWLLNEAKATGEHTLKRTLGPVSLTALGVGAVIGAAIAGRGHRLAGAELAVGRHFDRFDLRRRAAAKAQGEARSADKRGQ